jgi:hypothetical protein
VLRDGGAATKPMVAGHTASGSSEAALQKTFDSTQRAPTKLNAMVRDNEITIDRHTV